MPYNAKRLVAKVAKAFTRLTLLVTVISWCQACTINHTSQKTAQLKQSLYMNDKLDIKRRAQWVLPTQSRIYIAYPSLGFNHESSYPRLRSELANNLRLQAQLRYPNVRIADLRQNIDASWHEARINQADFLFDIRVNQAQEKISSVYERRASLGFLQEQDDGAIAKAPRGRDQLGLVMHIYDVRSGQLLDTVEVNAKSAWTHRQNWAPITMANKAIMLAFDSLQAG